MLFFFLIPLPIILLLPLNPFSFIFVIYLIFRWGIIYFYFIRHPLHFYLPLDIHGALLSHPVTEGILVVIDFVLLVLLLLGHNSFRTHIPSHWRNLFPKRNCFIFLRGIDSSRISRYLLLRRLVVVWKLGRTLLSGKVMGWGRRLGLCFELS